MFPPLKLTENLANSTVVHRKPRKKNPALHNLEPSEKVPGAWEVFVMVLESPFVFSLSLSETEKRYAAHQMWCGVYASSGIISFLGHPFFLIH